MNRDVICPSEAKARHFRIRKRPIGPARRTRLSSSEHQRAATQVTGTRLSFQSPGGLFVFRNNFRVASTLRPKQLSRLPTLGAVSKPAKAESDNQGGSFCRRRRHCHAAGTNKNARRSVRYALNGQVPAAVLRAFHFHGLVVYRQGRLTLIQQRAVRFCSRPPLSRPGRLSVSGHFPFTEKSAVRFRVGAPLDFMEAVAQW